MRGNSAIDPYLWYNYVFLALRPNHLRKYVDCLMNEWMNDGTNEWTNQRINEPTNKQINK